MKKLLYSSLLVLISLNTLAQKVVKLWETDTVLNIPESVLFADSVLYVSCINGTPTEKNENGYISKLTLSGEILKRKWATGINAPKGMAAYKGFLFVADINRVAVIDIKSGVVVNFFNFKDAKFLNDVVVGENGRIYISDSGDKSIYVIHEEFSKLFLQDVKLQGVNGLFYENEYLLAGTKNNVYKVDKTGRKVDMYIPNTGSVDGLIRVNAKQMLNSDWSGKVQIISKDKTPLTLLDFDNPKYNAADFDFNKKESILYIPTFFGNTVAAYRLMLE